MQQAIQIHSIIAFSDNHSASVSGYESAGYVVAGRQQSEQ